MGGQITVHVKTTKQLEKDKLFFIYFSHKNVKPAGLSLVAFNHFFFFFFRWAYLTFVQKKETPPSNSSTEESFQGEINQLGQTDLCQREQGLLSSSRKEGERHEKIFIIKSLNNFKVVRVLLYFQTK